MIDIWWLVWGVFLVAIIERNNLLDESKKWFDIFRILFELVSAFGGIGLSLGVPDVRMPLIKSRLCRCLLILHPG
jgi:Trk-type K+ transport system membrane component